jgi:PilZ domain-containing protein
METTESNKQKKHSPSNPSPGKVWVSMQISRRLNGRVERRLPLMVAVRLSRGTDSPEGEELAYTDNISRHGVRVVCKHSWRSGEFAHIGPVKEGSPMRGQVVYCQSLNDSFCVGFKFEEPVTWPLLTRYQDKPSADWGTS